MLRNQGHFRFKVIASSEPFWKESSLLLRPWHMLLFVKISRHLYFLRSSLFEIDAVASLAKCFFTDLSRFLLLTSFISPLDRSSHNVDLISVQLSLPSCLEETVEGSPRCPQLII